MKEEFGTLKQNTVIQIFKASLSREGITRSEIADEVGMSVMTVGKAVDALIELDVLRQSHAADSTPGRPTRAIYPSRHKWIAVYEISEELLSFFMLDLSLKCIDSFSYTPVSTAFPDDEIKYFVHLSRVFASSRRKSPDCVACGILVPCSYDMDGDRLESQSTFLSRIRPLSLFEGYTFNRTPYMGNLRIFNSMRLGRVLENGAYAIAFYLDRGDIKSSVITKSSGDRDNLSNTRLFDAGAFRMQGGKSLRELSMAPDNIDRFCFCLTELIMTSVCALGINTVILCGTIFNIDIIRSVIGDMVYRRCADDGLIPPEIISGSENEEATKGISEEMRDKWFFEEMIDSY